MKVNKEQAQRNRQSVIDAAARLYRQHGVAGIGLADLCRSVGLTHGSFYSQFPGGKQELTVLAIEQMFRCTTDRWLTASDLATVMRGYIDAEHCTTADPCPVPTLAADASRLGGEIEAAFNRGIRRMLDTLAQLSAADTPAGRQEQAAQALAMAAGAVLIGRAGGDAGSAFMQRVKAAWPQAAQ